MRRNLDPRYDAYWVVGYEGKEYRWTEPLFVRGLTFIRPIGWDDLLLPRFHVFWKMKEEKGEV